MIEAMACGTPILAFRHGSAPEIIDQGVTGAVVDTMDEAVTMLPEVLKLDRRAVRRRFEQRFSAARMSADYVALYRSLIKQPFNSERETIVPLPRLPKPRVAFGRLGMVEDTIRTEAPFVDTRD
jgi:hypothetical protein